MLDFTDIPEGLKDIKEYYEEGGSVNMCQALTELIEDGRMEGRREGKIEGIELTKRVYKAHYEGKNNQMIAKECNISVSQVEEILK